MCAVVVVLVGGFFVISAVCCCYSLTERASDTKMPCLSVSVMDRFIRNI